MALGVSYLTLVSQHFFQDRQITADDTASPNDLTLQGCTTVSTRTSTLFVDQYHTFGVCRQSIRHYTSLSPYTSPRNHLARLKPYRKSGRCTDADLAVCAYARNGSSTAGPTRSRHTAETYIIVRTSVTSHIIIVTIVPSYLQKHQCAYAKWKTRTKLWHLDRKSVV